MAESVQLSSTRAADQRPWDARLARRLIAPLKDSWVTPNHLTTVRLAVGIGAAAAFTPGTYLWLNIGALLLVLSNFLDHADGELARIGGKSSRIGHIYDLASDALVTVLVFVAIGIAVNTSDRLAGTIFGISPTVLGVVAGIAVAVIFFLRMRIETMAGKAGTRQAMLAGFETEDILYLLPLVALCNGVVSFLIVAAFGAPLFAVWVAIDYRRALSRYQPDVTRPVTDSAELRSMSHGHCEANLMTSARLAAVDTTSLRREFVEQGAFLNLAAFGSPEMVARLVSSVEAARALINRNYIPGHKQGGSVSRRELDEVAPFVGDLYRAPALIAWLSQLSGEALQPAPAADPHAYAFYFYTNPGDHIGWHYDTSYYAGRRYTVLLGVIDDSSCRLEYQLHTREVGAVSKAGATHMAPGDLVFFDGDRLRHRITPLGHGETRVSLTFEYVTDPKMHPWWRFVSNMKDAVAYFGFRQVFRRR